MEEFDKLKWVAIIPLLGVILGWSLSQFSNWYKSRIEDKRILKRSLFHLLEVYYNLSRTDFDEKLDQFVNDSDLKLQPEAIKVINHLRDDKTFDIFLSSKIFEEVKNNQNQYLETINTLSSVEPILSFELKKDFNVLELFSNIENIVGKPLDANILKSNFYNNLKKKIIEHELRSLEYELLSIARKIGFRTLFRTKQTLSNINKDPFSLKDLAPTFLLSYLQTFEEF